MGDMIGDGAEFSCPFCTSKIKIKVLSSPTTGDGKKIANKANHLFPPPGGQCTIIPNAPVPCVPAVTIIDEGQKPISLSNIPGLGKGCKGMCAKGGTLTVSSPGQGVSIHDGASAVPPLKPAPNLKFNPTKHDYLFGEIEEPDKDDPNYEKKKHNYDRAQGNRKQMDRLGIKNNDEGKKLLEKHFAESIKSDNISKTWTRSFPENGKKVVGTFEARESLLFGPSGKAAKVEATFRVGENGTREFVTAIFWGG